MIKLKKIELENVGTHRSLTLELSGGMSVLVGRNGGGKSTILDALHMVFAGEPLRSDWGRPAMLSWGHKTGSITAVVEIDGEDWTVVRALPQGRNDSLIKGSDKTTKISGAEKVNESLISMMECGIDALKVSAFMPQNGALNLLFGTAGQRKEEFTRILRLGHLPRCRDMARDALSAMPAPVDHEPEKKAIKDSLPSFRDLILQCQQTVDRTQSDMEDARDARDKVNAMLALPTKEDIESRKAAVKADIDRFVQQMAALNHTSEPPAPVERPDFARASDYTKMLSVYAELEKLRASIDAYKIPMEPLEPLAPDLSGYDELNGMIYAKQRELAELEKWAKLGKCPTCGTAKCVDAGQIQIIKESLNELVEGRNAVNQIKADYDKEKAQHAQLVHNRQSLLNKLEVLRGKEESLSGDLEKLMAKVGDLDPDAHDAQSAAYSSYEKLRQQYDKNAAQHKESERRVFQLNQTLEGLDKLETRPKIDSWQHSLATSLPEMVEKHNKATGELAVAEDTLKRAEARLVELDKLAVSDVKLIAERRVLEEVRDLLHPDSLPKALANQFKDTLQQRINNELAELEQPFRVEIDAELSFHAIFGNGRGPAGAALSGGQRALLMTATRLALTDLMGGRLRMLCLDEPAAALDQDNRVNLVEALDQVKKRLRAKGVQMLIVSHDMEILTVADKEIKL